MRGWQGRQSVAREGALNCRQYRQVPAGFAGLDDGFFAFRGLTLTGLRGVAGRITVGRPTVLAETSLGSGLDLKCARQAGESCDLFRTMQAVTRLMSGMSELQSRKASPVQACSCSGV